MTVELDLHTKRLLGARKLLAPLVRFCLRRSIKFPELLELLKMLFVEAAEKELKRSNTPVSASRISAMTGVHRKDISRFAQAESNSPSPSNAISRIMTQWRHDSRFWNAPGEPRPLSVEGRESEFSRLVHSVLGGDLSGYAILYEMERMGVCVRDSGKVRLLWRDFAPAPDEIHGTALLAGDLEALVSTVEENIFSRQSIPNLHLRTVFDNIVSDAIPEIRRWILHEGSLFQERVSR